LGLIPADGVRVVDVLNDFQLTDTGRYRLPNLQHCSPLDIVVQLKVGPQEVRTQLRLVDLRLGFTPQELKNAEVLKEAHVVEFARESGVDALAPNQEVIKTVQFLMNARARNEAMKRMDRGDYFGAQAVIGSVLHATFQSCKDFASEAEVMEECALLESS